MKRQASEGHYSASNRSPHEPARHSEGGRTVSHRQNDIDKASGPKKTAPVPRRPARNGPVKVLSRELDSDQSLTQKTDPGNEREIGMNIMRSPKHMKVVASLLNTSDQQSTESDHKKPLSAITREKPTELPRQKSGAFNRRVEIYSRSKNGTPNSYTPASVEKNKTEMSGAIFERDEADEDDHKESQRPSQNALVEEKRAYSTDQALLSQQEYLIQEPILQRGPSEPGTGLKKETYKGIYKFSENPNEPSYMGISKSSDGTPNRPRATAHIRGAFMNEHITMTEMEKQKEKQRKMREALDSQLNEKKQKIQEEKLKQEEQNKKEEMRIRKEMEQLKYQHEKEAAYENIRKGTFKTEENDSVSRDTTKPPSAVQTEKPEKTHTESDVMNTSTNNVNMSFFNQSRDDQKLLISPVRVRGKTESRSTSKDIFEPKSHGSPVKAANVDNLVDENKKLRDENSKKEELIDVLIKALKNKEGTAQNLQDKTNLYNSPKKEPASALLPKPSKPINIEEAETDFYGYYLNGYVQSKPKFQAASEQPSSHNHYVPKDTSYSMSEDKNYSMNTYDKVEIKDHKPRILRKPMPDYTMEPAGALASHNNSPYYRMGMGNAHNLSSVFGPTPSNRGYSSPLVGNLNKSAFTSPLHKMDGKSGSFMPMITPNAGNTGATLEKAIGQGTPGLVKSHVTHSDLILNPAASSLFRMKKRQDQSMDHAESAHDIMPSRKVVTSERPAINIIDEDGSYAVTKPNHLPKREYIDLIHPYSSPSFGMYDYKKLDIIDTSTLPDKYPSKGLSMSVSPHPHEGEIANNHQMKLFGKIALYGGAYDSKRASDDLGKDKWAMGDISALKKTKKEEIFEKTKVLPSLESKSKFPKEVFPSNLRKKICP